MACAILILLSGSILLYSWQSRRADRRVKQVATLADSAISDMTEKLQQSSTSVETQALLFHRALQYLNQLRQSSHNDPRLLLQLSKAYGRVGDLEGSPFVANLGNSGTALVSYQEALRAATEAHSRLPGDESTEAVVEAYQRLGRMEAFLGNIREARDDYGKSLPLALDLWRRKPDDAATKRLLAVNDIGIGDVELSSLEPAKALQSYREATQVFGNDPDGTEDHDRMLTRLYLRTARAQNELGLQSETLANTRKAIAITENLAQKSPSGRQVKQDLFSAYQNMVLALAGRDLMNVGDSRQAQIYARKALGIAIELAASDNENMQTRDAVARAYVAMGDSFRLVRPTVSAAWYQKSLLLTNELIPHYGSEARHMIAERNEALAEVLEGNEQARERLQLLQEANQFRRELAGASPHGRIHLMSSYCKLSDAELAVGNLKQAQSFTNSALPFLDEFKPNSPSLLVLRDVGRCYESIGNVQRQIAENHSLPVPESQTAKAKALQWYRRSADVWSEWNRRGVATPESEIQRRRLEGYLENSQRLPQ
jgi:tetratricopeptide (TPR) repeat protein